MLDDLLAAGEAEGFDLVFIDGNMILEDKRYEYYEYYWRSLALLRQGGLLVLDIVSDDVNQQFLPFKSLVENKYISTKVPDPQTRRPDKMSATTQKFLCFAFETFEKMTLRTETQCFTPQETNHKSRT